MPLFNAYRYEPLQAEDAIRLISLDPAADDTTPPSCSIIQRQHSTQNFKYHAVSYAWGKREFSRTLEIRCDGDTSYLRITHNVDALLRRLRRRKKRRYLWVDAICLDQNDETEKTQQIPVMGRIFEEATMVHIWLGHEDDMTAKIFAVFRKVSVLPEVKQQQMAETIATLMRTNIRDDGSSGINFVVAFFDRSWFKRRWVIQEAALARQATVHCGSSSILLPGLIAAAHRLQSLDLSWYSVKMVANLGRTEAKLSTLEVLWHFHEADCLEPKDRVAALFGLVSESDRFALDYTLHWADLYKQVALRAFSCGDNDVRLQMLLHLFEFGPLRLVKDSDFPSWIPDWSRTRQRSLPYHSDIRNPDTHEAYPTSPGISDKATLMFSHNTLQIHWAASPDGPQGGRVIYSKKFDSIPYDDEQRTGRVLRVLNELFPSNPRSTLHIFAFASLLHQITEFREPRRDQILTTAPLDEYIKNVNVDLPRCLNAHVFDSLRKLDSVLQDLYICELKPFNSTFETCRVYALSREETKVGDIMIPLWSPKWVFYEPIPPLGGREPAIHISTMVVGRYTAEQDIYNDETGLLDVLAQKAKIIGPATSVTVTPRSRFDWLMKTTFSGVFFKNRRYAASLV